MSGDNPWGMVNLEKIIQIAFRGIHIRAIEVRQCAQTWLNQLMAQRKKTAWH